MATYARIYSGAVAELFETNGDMATMFHPDIVWADVSNESPIPDVGWTAEKTDGIWKFTEKTYPVLHG